MAMTFPYQFESIHPFYDGNGRTGRIINILYLIQNNLLDIPVLYLSKYILRTKESYYSLLQEVREKNAWEEWVIYMLKGIEATSKETILIIQGMRELMRQYKNQIRSQFPKFYSQDLLNNLFKHPYTKIEFIEHDLNVTRQTAAKYLDALAQAGLMKKEKMGKHNFYINEPLFKLFQESR
jgi:Fic family protein